MAVVRVKRRLQDDPLEVLYVTCKKFKSEDPGRAVFKFAATVINQDDDVSPHIKEAISSISQFPSKQKTAESISNKMKIENKMASHNNRLKVVNCFRSVSEKGESGNGESEGGKAIALFDMEDCGALSNASSRAPTNSSDPEVKAEEVQPDEFVYDLYYSPDPSDILIERIMSSHGNDMELYFEKMEDECDDDYMPDDEDDSNDENNWRNDYPDEEDGSSGTGDDEDGIVRRMRAFKLGKDSDLSSDDGEEDLIYGMEDARDVYDYSLEKEESRGSSDNSDYDDCNDGDFKNLSFNDSD